MKYQIRGGIRQRGLASSAERQIETMTASFVTVPLSDRAEDVTPLVAVGDFVYVGTKLSDPPSGTPAHASVSGTVVSTEDHLLAIGRYFRGLWTDQHLRLTARDQKAGV